ncbi:hypothetical protein V1639_12360 [Pseudarthrobacter sp. J75]|nr:hypothetical protein [Pseudarthrobacter sp. J75]MEE2529813.1 hypothetical protein [Pseudarthrobacter sp. J75]
MSPLENTRQGRPRKLPPTWFDEPVLFLRAPALAAAPSYSEV